MFHAAQQLQHLSNAQPTSKCSTAKMGKIQQGLSFLQFLGGLTIGLFLAGVVVPSIFRSGMAANYGSASGFPYALTIGGVTFVFTIHNLCSALLGGAFGALIALAIEFPDAFAQTAGNFLMFQRLCYQKLRLILLQFRGASGRLL